MDLKLSVDQVVLVKDHSFSGPRKERRTSVPSLQYVGLKGQATVEGFGAGLAILGSDMPPVTQLPVDITPYDGTEWVDGSEWAERARTSWPVLVSFWEGVGWYLNLRLPRPAHEQLTNAIVAGRLAHLKFEVKLEAWVEENLRYRDDLIVYLPPKEPCSGYITRLGLQERLLVLTEPAENTAQERAGSLLLMK